MSRRKPAVRKSRPVPVPVKGAAAVAPPKQPADAALAGASKPASRQPRSSRISRRTALICGGLVLINLIVFGRILGFSFISLDDPQAVVQNYIVNSGFTKAGLHWALTQTQTFYWQPLTWLSHMLDCELFGLNSSRHHAINLLVHIANTLLLFLLLRRLTRLVWQSALVAVLFSIHPLATESVAWVAGRRDLLSGFFSLVAIWTYVEYGKRPASWSRYVWMLAASALAFASKPMTASLPLLMLLLDAVPLGRWKRRASLRSIIQANLGLLREKAPLFLMAAVLVGVTVSSIHSTMDTLAIPRFPVSSRIATSLAAVAFYVGRTVWPFSLAPMGAYSAAAPWQVEGATLLFIGISLLALAAARRAPFLIAGWTWYVVALLPTFLYAEVGTQFMADHLTYLPLIGLLVMLVGGASALVLRTRFRVPILIAAAALLVGALGLRTFSQANTWKDTAAVYEHTIRVASDHYATLQSLCAAAVRDHDIADAVADYYSKRSLADPLSPRLHYILGSLLFAKGSKQKAIAQFAEALRHDPDSAQLRKAYAFALLDDGKRERALAQFTETLRLAPDDPDRDRILAVLPDLKSQLPAAPLDSALEVFTPGTAVEVAAVLLCLCVGFLAPKLGAVPFRRIETLGLRVATRPVLSICIAGLAPMALRLLLLPLYPVPQPRVADEFGHLLIADTLASGRMTNPTHPMWEHFESIYVLQHPSYTSIYPIAKGSLLALPVALGINPWFGVWASVGAMCAILCWMLQAWLPPPWALLGALLAVIRFSILGHWMNSLWGGSVSAIGGALVLGALPRIFRHQRVRDATLLGLGVAILSQSRPYEGLLLAVPVFGTLLVWCLRSSQIPWRVRAGRVWGPLSCVIALDVLIITWYNWRVTGNPLLLPYLLYQKLYGTPQPFFWQHPVPAPPGIAHYRDIADNYAWQLQHYLARSSWLSLTTLTSGKLADFWSFYFGPVLTAPLLFLPWIWGYRRLRLLLIVAAIVLLGVAFYPFFFPHYVALICGALLAVVVQGIRYLRSWKWRGRRVGLFFSRTLLLLVLSTSFLDTASTLFDPAWLKQDTPRNRILEQLRRAGGKHLVLVRYGAQHMFHNSWIYNSANIDASSVVWARELDPARNQKLLQYFAGRRVWLLQVDEIPIRFSPYLPPSTSLAPIRETIPRVQPRSPSLALRRNSRIHAYR